MKNRLKITALVLGLSVVVVIALAAWYISQPSDDMLKDRFYAHRPEFEKLVVMANEDDRLFRIAPDFIGPEDGFADFKITETRWNEYRQLFHTTGVTTGISKDIQPARIYFPIYTRGIVPAGATKGIVYSQLPLNPDLKSLDEAPPNNLYEGPDHNHLLVYKQIEEHWYIYYEEW